MLALETSQLFAIYEKLGNCRAFNCIGLLVVDRTHRIMKLLGLEETSEDHVVQPPFTKLEIQEDSEAQIK